MQQLQQDMRFNQAFKPNDSDLVPFGEVAMNGRFIFKNAQYQRIPSDPHGFNAIRGGKSDKHKFKDTELVRPIP